LHEEAIEELQCYLNIFEGVMLCPTCNYKHLTYGFFSMNETENKDAILRSNIQMEIGPVAWIELARFFAMGSAIVISRELDLAEVAFQISKDNKTIVSQWMLEGKVARVSDEQAKIWFETEAMVSAVVIKPWVLVQTLETMH
jgi:hypothetical protein